MVGLTLVSRHQFSLKITDLEFAIARTLRERGWIVPAYTMVSRITGMSSYLGCAKRIYVGSTY